MSVEGRPALTENDIVIASGCSGALDLAITVLLNPGDNLLIPKPAFSLYQTLCESKGMAVKQYRLLPEKCWEADLEHLEAQIDERTRAILVNNPSNPCGSVYSADHLKAIIDIAEKHRLPIIADEIYGNLVFPSLSPSPFIPMASLSDNVPIIAAGGIAKEFLVPGWRVGWLAVHDRHGALEEVRKGLYALSQLILGACSLIVSALPAILAPAEGSEEASSLAKFHKDVVTQLEDHAVFTFERLRKIPGVTVVVPQGAMYVMMGIDPTLLDDACADDYAFAKALLDEENVLMLPGTAFQIPNYLRIVFSAPKDKLAEAFDRLEAFCRRHLRPEAAARLSGAAVATASVGGGAAATADASASSSAAAASS